MQSKIIYYIHILMYFHICTICVCVLYINISHSNWQCILNADFSNASRPLASQRIYWPTFPNKEKWEGTSLAWKTLLRNTRLPRYFVLLTWTILHCISTIGDRIGCNLPMHLDLNVAVNRHMISGIWRYSRQPMISESIGLEVHSHMTSPRASACKVQTSASWRNNITHLKC